MSGWRAGAAGLSSAGLLALGLAALPATNAGLAGAAGDPATTAVQPLTGDAARGQRLYQQGLQADGQPLRARREGVGPLPTSGVACVHCHRPSTMGGSEGGLLVPPLLGSLLFAAAQPAVRPRVGPGVVHQGLRYQSRSAYTEPLLQRALADGLDPDGVALDVAMPRYALDAQAVADLAAYLRQRAQAQPPGLVGNTLHLASVFTPQAPALRRETVAAAMSAWARQTRLGPWSLQWHAWSLKGSPAGWPAQLQALAARQPVYGLLSGAGGADWTPVQAWCEQQALPCLFPVIDRLPAAASCQYSAYLSAGLDGEVGLAAAFLRQSSPATLRVLLLAQGDLGQQAAAALRQRLASSRFSAPSVRAWPALGGLGGLRLSARDVLVLWAPAAAVQALFDASPAVPTTTNGAAALPGGSSVPAGPLLLLSAEMAPPRQLRVPAAWRSRVRWVSMRSDPVRQEAAAALSQGPWAQALGLAVANADPAALADVHAATFFFADALSRMRGSLSADHLLEKLEAAVDQRPAGAGYFRLSLGPGQRIATQGGHVLAFQPAGLAFPAPSGPFLLGLE